MASITLENLNKTYPNGFVSVKNLSLHIEDGEFVTFFGPSGCGKSTILRMIGGMEDITSGEIYLGKDLLNDILPRDRSLAMAFQNYQLYSHLNVYDNIALGLRLRNLPRQIIDSRVKMAAHFFNITDILEKKIRVINEAQKQRVALGRAVVCKPKVLLVDEDFARQNEYRRKEMMRDIRRINKELGITVLYVTNKRGETEIAGQKVISMRDGEIVDIKKMVLCETADIRNRKTFLVKTAVRQNCGDRSRRFNMYSFLFSAFQILVNIPLGHSPVLCDSFHC